MAHSNNVYFTFTEIGSGNFAEYFAIKEVTFCGYVRSLMIVSQERKQWSSRQKCKHLYFTCNICNCESAILCYFCG